MKIVMKIASICLATAVSLMGTVTSYAATARNALTTDIGVLDTTKVDVIDVAFMTSRVTAGRRAGTEVFKMDEIQNNQVYCNVTISNPLDDTTSLPDLSMCIASYDSNDRFITSQDCHPDLIKGVPTVATPTLNTAGASYVKLFIWDNLTDIKPYSICYTLNDVSRDNRVDTVTATINNKTYTGLVNNVFKTVRFYIPTISTDSLNSQSYAVYESNANIGDTNMADGYNQTIRHANFTSYVSSVPLTIATNGSVDKSGAQNFSGSEPVKYRITAGNGEVAEYEVQICPLAVTYSSNFGESVKLGTTYEAATIPTLQDVNGNNFSTDVWTNNSNAKASIWRTGTFINGSKGGGSWRFKSNGVLYQAHDNDTSDQKIGFAGNSMIKMGFGVSDGTDGHTNGDRYGVINYGYDNTTTGNTSYYAYHYQNGVQAAHSYLSAFDFKLSNDTGSGYVRLESPYFQMRLKSGSAIALRGSAADSAFAGASSRTANDGGYSTLTSGEPSGNITPDQWHKMAIITRALPSAYSDTNKRAIINEVYYDGKFVGYQFALDYAVGFANSSAFYNNMDVFKCYHNTVDNGMLKFANSYNARVDLGLDNYCAGAPYEIGE